MSPMILPPRGKSPAPALNSGLHNSLNRVKRRQRVMETTQPDLVTCSCNVCEGHLQFDGQHAGERVNCPHCGMETLLYVPQGAPKRIAGLPSAPPSSTVAEAPPVIQRTAATKTPPREQLTRLYYYRIKDETKGPYTIEQLRGLWMNGQITADALYRSEDSSQWLPLRDSLVLSAGESGGQILTPVPPLIPPPLRTVHSSAPNAMNAIQKQVLVGGVAVMLVMGLFPPWAMRLHTSSPYEVGNAVEAGYHFVLTPPKHVRLEAWDSMHKQRTSYYHAGDAWIEYGQLVFQWAITALATAVGVGLCGLKKNLRNQL